MRLVEIMQHSRMGLYEHQGVENECVWLRELVTGVDARCLVPAGRLGKTGEVWLARRLPPPSAEFRDSIVITTPYVIVHPPAPDWHAFLERTLPKLKCSTPYEAYDRLMKYGLSLSTTGTSRELHRSAARAAQARSSAVAPAGAVRHNPRRTPAIASSMYV